MRLAVLPGVFRPHSDSWLLARHLRGELEPGSSVADLCTGSGLLAVTAALAGARPVMAVDISRRAIASARLNALLNRVSMEAVRGDLFEPLRGRRFDVIVSNPPYVPAANDTLPTRGRARAWDAGRNGRALLDRLCVEAPTHLRSAGKIMLVHSDVCDASRTVALLTAQGLEAEVIGRAPGPLGPLLSARRDDLARRGLLHGDAQTEEMVVIRGQVPSSEAQQRAEDKQREANDLERAGCATRSSLTFASPSPGELSAGVSRLGRRATRRLAINRRKEPQWRS